MSDENKPAFGSRKKKEPEAEEKVVKEPEAPSAVECINCRDSAPVFSDVTKSNIPPGKKGQLSPEIFKLMEQKGYVKAS
jgi:hypothetical protein